MAGQTVFSEMWKAYRGVVLHSIVTSFGLDFIVRDQHGGDVDTIHGVRETGQYKNARNAAAYEARGEYDRVAYHHNDAYDSTVRTARDTHAFFDDAYVPGNKIYYGKASALRDPSATELGTRHKANLDHVISAHEIHEDRGRVLAGKDGVEMANTAANLQFTNEYLNKSMIDRSEFIRKVVERLNVYGSVEYEIRETSESFIALAAEIAHYDITEFTDQIEKLDGFTRQMLRANDDELHDILLDTFEEFGIPLPWDGDFDDFMGNPDNCLVFD